MLDFPQNTSRLTGTAHRIVAALAIIVLCALPSVSANAQDTKTSRTVITLDTITVEGRIQKPQAFYILPRTNLDYEGLDRGESFLPRIEEAVEKDPF